MTNIETLKKGHDILSDTGRTSPLSHIASTPPIHSDISDQNQMTVEKKLDKLNNPLTPSADVNVLSNNINHNGVSKTNGRSIGVVSDESSDLSDLDSEAETERMYTGDESELARISKINEDTTLQENVEMIDNDDTITKDEVEDQINDEMENGVHLDVSGEIGKVVEELKSKEEIEKSPELSQENENSHKRPHSEPEDTEGSDTKRSKNGDGKVDKEKENFEAKPESKPLEQETVEAGIPPIVKTDLEQGEDEDDEDNEEEEEEELTEEQKLQKQIDLEADLEKQKQRKEAIAYLTEIEIEFAKLRDRLYEDKMARFKSELEMCLDGSHPELQTVYIKIDSHREEKIKLASLSRKYRSECIDRQTRATRTQIHQQFYKRVSDQRSKQLNDVTTEWYKINKERREMDLMASEYSYDIPEYVEEIVDQREQINEEISVLTGLQHYYGFPKAPTLRAVEGSELEKDLRAMNLR